jgi:hypothetical protein
LIAPEHDALENRRAAAPKRRLKIEEDEDVRNADGKLLRHQPARTGPKKYFECEPVHTSDAVPLRTATSGIVRIPSRVEAWSAAMPHFA